MTDVARAWKADVACVAGLALAVAGFFPHVVIDWGVFFVQDMMVQNVPFRHFLHEALAAGRLPLWNRASTPDFPCSPKARSAPCIRRTGSARRCCPRRRR